MFQFTSKAILLNDSQRSVRRSQRRFWDAATAAEVARKEFDAIDKAIECSDKKGATIVPTLALEQSLPSRSKRSEVDGLSELRPARI